MAAAAAAEQQQVSETSAVAAPALPGGGSGSGSAPVLFCFSVFARPSTVPRGSGYEVLIQKFLSLYGDQLDMHRKFVVQLFSEEWSQYIDLPKGFLVSERCKVRLVPLQIQVGARGGRPDGRGQARRRAGGRGEERLASRPPPLGKRGRLASRSLSSKAEGEAARKAPGWKGRHTVGQASQRVGTILSGCGPSTPSRWRREQCLILTGSTGVV